MEALLNKIDQNILQEIDEIIYIFKRYKIPSTICVAKFSQDVHIDDIKKNIRRTDKAFKRDSCIIIIYKFVHAENGVKAFQNLIYKLNLDRQKNEKKIENKTLQIKDEESKTFYNHLFQRIKDSMFKRRTIKTNSFLSAIYQTAKGAISVNELTHSLKAVPEEVQEDEKPKDVIFHIHNKIEDVSFSSSFYQIKTSNISSKEIMRSSIKELLNSPEKIKIID